MISQRAIAIAETLALRFTDSISDHNHPSFNKSWTNVYLSPFDQSGNIYKLKTEEISLNFSCRSIVDCSGIVPFTYIENGFVCFTSQLLP